MKRTLETDATEKSLNMKRTKPQQGEQVEEEGGGGGGGGGVDSEYSGTGFENLDENLLFEVFKHVDARTLGRAACVSKQWHRTALDERLWELICTRHGANIGCGNQQLRSVVLALGGFRRLHSQFLVPLSKPQSSSSSSSSSWVPPFPAMMGSKPPARWGKDEVHLSLSLLSIRYYEKMNFTNRGR